MRQGSSKNPSGIGGTIEDVGCLGGFASHTGGSLVQRRMDNNYSKADHASQAKAQAAAREEARETDLGPASDVSGPYRVL